jgi:O-antigen/teichoic acid export membrane protein
MRYGMSSAGAGEAAGGRSAVPLVCGILSIIFGTLASLVVVITLFLWNPPGPEDDLARWPRLGSFIAYACLSPTLIFLGVGQTEYERWIANGTLIWASLALIAAIVYALLLYHGTSGESAEEALEWWLFSSVYPFALLICFLQHRVRSSLGRQR